MTPTNRIKANRKLRNLSNKFQKATATQDYDEILELLPEIRTLTLNLQLDNRLNGALADEGEEA